MAESEFTLSNGRKLKIRSVSPFMLGRLRPAVMKEFKVGKFPTYIVETVGGGSQEFSHDATTLDVEDDPEQSRINWKEWNEYHQKLALVSLEANRRFLILLLRRGVDVEVPEDDSWQADHRASGIEIPEDPVELKIMYIQDELIHSKSEWGRLCDEILALSDITEEDVAAATESFLDNVEGSGIKEGDQSSSEG